MWLRGLGPILLLATGFQGSSVAAASRSVISMSTNKPEHVGQCFSTRVRRVTFRLFDEATGQSVPNSGSKVLFVDGHENVGYDQVPTIDASRADDPVRLCVRALPTGCPASDSRGIVYTAKNLRTAQTWEGSDSTHPCDGA
jgi:hypothetical protein